MAYRRDYGFDDVPGASYDEARQDRERRRPVRFGGGGDGRGDAGFRWLAVWFGLAALVVAGRLLWLQVFQAGQLTSAANTQRTYTLPLHAKRGTIYDRNGNVLAVSEDCETIYANPQQVNDAATASRLIAESLGGSWDDYLDNLLKTDTTYVFVRRQVDESVAQALMEKLDEAGITGIGLNADTRRSYPYGAAGGQVLGFVGIDGDGLSGIELYYNDILKGTDGEIAMQYGNLGTPIAGVDNTITPAKNGTDIVISLDINVQQVAEEQIAQAVEDYEADSGSVMVTDPQTGEILAACSTPLLDLTDVSEAPAEAYSMKLVTASYEPGSIFKVVTAAIGVDAGLIDANSTWTVPPEIQVGDDYVQDVDLRDYTMNMSLREIMRRSSNVGMALIGQQMLGATLFSEGVATFQIGQATGIDYPGESAGLVKGLDEYDGSTLGNMAFGQGLAMPMVQMVKAVGSIANGGTLLTPHFLVAKEGEDVAWEPTGTSVTPETCAEVTDIMRTVVDEGTAMDADVEGYDVAAKTGTGQQIDEEHGGYKENSFVSSLIGFANASDPHVLVYVGLNGTAYHGSAAGSAFSAIMGEALSDCGVRPE